MPEDKKRVQVYKVDYICDECGEGRMRSTGQALLSKPVMYPHECTHCGAKKTFRGITYPTKRTEEIQE